MATIMHLPDELIAFILKNKSIGIKDISSFKSTCKRFAQITLNNEFWKEKYCQRCSTAAKRYKKLKKAFNHLNIEEQLKLGTQCIKKLRHYVLLLLRRNFWETDGEQFNCLLHFVVENSIVYYFVWDELNRIISEELSDMQYEELFWKFYFAYSIRKKNYFKLIFFCLKQYRLQYKLFKFVNKPKENQIVERQLVIIAQYSLPHVPYSVINTWLDDVTQEVLSRLKHEYPMHSIFSIPSEQFSFWRDNNISENFWNPTEASQIIHIVEEYIFCDLEIHKLYETLITSNLEELNSIPGSYLDRIVLIIIYHIVTRRFGINDGFLNMEITHFRKRLSYIYDFEMLLIWKPKYKIDWDFNEFFRVNKEFDLWCALHIDEGKHNFIIPSERFDDTLYQKELEFDICFYNFIASEI